MSAKSQLPWSDKQEECLLNLVLTQGLHLLRGSKGVQDKWERLYSDLFLNDVLLSYKEEHYKAGSSRKVRDKYESILEKISKNIDKGNQSVISNSPGVIGNACSGLGASSPYDPSSDWLAS